MTATATKIKMPSVAESINQTIAALEKAVFQHHTDEGVTHLLTLLGHLSRHTEPMGLVGQQASEIERNAIYTRIAAMISALVCSPNFKINLDQVNELCGRKPLLESIFELSGYEGPFHLLGYHGKRDQAGNITLTSNQVFILSLFFSLDELPGEILSGVLQLPPDLMLPLILGWFAAPFVHSEIGENNRRAIIHGCDKLAQANPNGKSIQAITSAWMHCSYADSPDKHRFKHVLNSLWRNTGRATGIKDYQKTHDAAKPKPRLLVAAERMVSGHAMQRSYGQPIAQLRQKFHTVCLVTESFYSENLSCMFDEVALLPANIELGSLGSKVIELKPDLIYFPSLGMSDWTQAIANFRLAPIQVMTLGHPAPSMSQYIDYSLIQSGHGDAAHEFGNKVIERRSWGTFVPHPGLVSIEKQKAEQSEDGFFHVAVNSSMMKLSPRFLALCERLQNEANKPLHFHFFASASGVMFDRLSKVLRRKFKYLTIEPNRYYTDFIRSLNRCRLALSAFPFGNTNSTVDTCLLGIPTVAYVANEVLSIGDRDVMRMVGLPSWLVTDNDEDYFQVAMKLIHNDEARQAIVDQLAQTDVRAKVFEAPRPEDATEFVDAMDWIYRNHEALQASSQHLLKVGEPIPV